MLQVTCTDPKMGDIKYEVSPMEFSAENLKMFWEKCARYPTLFNEEIRANFEQFLALFTGQDSAGEIYGKGLVFRIDSPSEPMLGVFYMTDILGTEATVHFSFFDKRVRGREPLAKAMLEYAFKHYGFQRLNAEVPVYVKHAVHEFIRNIGFAVEGRKRRSVEYDNKFFDVFLYGILKEEILGREN